MLFEHVALNVSEPIKLVEWYEKNLGLTAVFKQDKYPFMHFLADESGKTLLEVYHNTNSEVPDYPNLHHLYLHLAFISNDSRSDRVKLEEAGASFVEQVDLDDGSCLIMMRDPWGIPLQLCQRAKALV